MIWKHGSLTNVSIYYLNCKLIPVIVALFFFAELLPKNLTVLKIRQGKAHPPNGLRINIVNANIQ